MYRIVIAFLIFSTFIVVSITAQYSFVNYDHTNGLPLDEINEIAEDHHGYIWLGGTLGLSRFDGRNFTHYYRGSNTHPLAGNIVNDIKVTPSGDVVVVFEENGLSIYNHRTDSFRSKTYSVSDSFNFPQLGISFIYIENDTSAYFGANNDGFFHINLKTFESKKIPIKFIPRDMEPVPFKKDTYYVTYGGLYELNLVDLSLNKLTKKGFAGISIIDDEIWYNDYASLVQKFNPKTNFIKDYKLTFPNKVRGQTILNQNLWVGTPDGVEIIDTASAELVYRIKAGPNIHDLQGGFIYHVFKDSKNRIWVANDGGLGLYDSKKTYFSRTTFLKHQSTELFLLDEDNLLSLDFYAKKAYKIENKKETIEINIKDELKSPNYVLKYDNKLLILFYNGIGEYEEKTNSITAFDSPFTRSKESGLIDLVIDQDQWLGIYWYQYKMLVWNTSSNETTTIKFKGEPKGLISTEDGNVWIYGINVLSKYNMATGQVVEFALNSEQFSSLSGDIVKIDKIGNDYYFSTRVNGISKAKYENEEFVITKHYTIEDGLTNNNVATTFIDDNNNLFVQCRTNIYVLDKMKDRFMSLGGQNDVNFQVTHGLAVIDSVVYALGYQSKSIDLRQVVTSFKELNTNIEHININGKQSLDFNYNVTELQHDENTIGITFNTIEFSEPAKIRHKYRLSTTDDWTYLDPGARTLQLTKLEAGNYQFQLAASKGDGLWSSPVEWKFSINLPIWKRWWFVLLLFCILALAAYSIYKNRTNQLKKINKMNLKLAELESESLRAQMNPHFIFNALNSIKAYIIKSNKEEAADYLTTFSELMRAVLRNSKQKEISLKNELEALSLYMQIEKFRLNQKFDFNIDVSEEIILDRVAFPPLIIQPFVENSIWHGFVNKKSKGNLNINIKRNDHKLIVEVIDDGIGREASKKIEKSRGRERSYGIAITENRLSNITSKAEVQIIDLYDESDRSCGTKVIIDVPYRFIEENQKK